MDSILAGKGHKLNNNGFAGVDLRSSKVCELGLLNYRAKHVFYPHERKKFRCHYDYYWASVFEVKYVDHSGQERLGSAEVPDEALPLNCRPSFGAAWLTKDKFKVNESYDCWYSLGISKVNMQHRGFLSCQAHDPSTFEMLRRYITLSLRILKSWFANSGSLDLWRLEVIAGIITGFVSALVTIFLLTFLRKLVSSLRQTMAERTYAASFGRVCFFLAYFTFMGWLTLEYAKRIGLPEILGYGYSW
ncbi:OLC1v1030960C4 [Oldenlandia corymbosa var. corymbosa]|nr:OLC1v1030960C4 [Oldenlandia corymbosa var. corymbosa]